MHPFRECATQCSHLFGSWVRDIACWQWPAEDTLLLLHVIIIISSSSIILTIPESSIVCCLYRHALLQMYSRSGNVPAVPGRVNTYAAELKPEVSIESDIPPG